MNPGKTDTSRPMRTPLEPKYRRRVAVALIVVGLGIAISAVTEYPRLAAATFYRSSVPDLHLAWLAYGLLFAGAALFVQGAVLLWARLARLGALFGLSLGALLGFVMGVGYMQAGALAYTRYAAATTDHVLQANQGVYDWRDLLDEAESDTEVDHTVATTFTFRGQPTKVRATPTNILVGVTLPAETFHWPSFAEYMTPGEARAASPNASCQEVLLSWMGYLSIAYAPSDQARLARATLVDGAALSSPPNATTRLGWCGHTVVFTFPRHRPSPTYTYR